MYKYTPCIAGKLSRFYTEMAGRPKGQPRPVQASDQEGARYRTSPRAGRANRDAEEHREAVRSQTQVIAMPSYIGLIHKDADSDFGVSFPDFPGAITAGKTLDEARAMAEEALGLVLLSYLVRGRPLPKPRAKGRNLVDIAVAPDVAAKLAVLECFAAAGISKSELARRIGKDEKEVRRILDPKHPTKLPALAAALRALGKRLMVGVMQLEGTSPFAGSLRPVRLSILKS